MLLNTYKNDFRENLKLAAPVMGSQLGQITVNTADMIMLGQLSADNLAAASLGNYVFILIMIFGMGIAMATTPLIAESDGKGDTAKTGSIFYHSIVLNLSLSFVLMVLTLLAIPYFDYLQQPEEATRLAKPYLTIVTYSFVPFMLFYTLKQYADGLSKTTIGMYATLVGNVINIAFNYVLIYGKFGFPNMGIEGAAWGTFISRCSMAGILVLAIFFSARLKTPLIDVGRVKLKIASFKTLIKIGVPSALQHLFEVGAFSAAGFITGLAGTAALAAHQVALSLASVTFMMCQGFAVAATVRVGSMLGKKDIEDLRNAGFAALIQVLLFMGICGTLMILTRHWLPYIYVDEAEVVSLAAILLIVASLFQLSDGAQVVMLGALRGLQDVRIPTVITFIAYWVLALPGCYLLGVVFEMGAIGVWISLGIGLSVSALFLVKRFHTLSRELISRENKE